MSIDKTPHKYKPALLYLSNTLELSTASILALFLENLPSARTASSLDTNISLAATTKRVRLLQVRPVSLPNIKSMNWTIVLPLREESIDTKDVLSFRHREIVPSCSTIMGLR